MQIIDLAPALHEAGKIKIGTGGEKRKGNSGREYRLPVKLDHFIVTSTERGPDGNFIINNAIMKRLTIAAGQKGPTEIPIRLLFDSIEENFDTSYSMFVGGKCICRGPGTGGTATRRKTRKSGNFTELTGESEDVPCGEQCEFYMGGGNGAQCKPYGILACILEDSLNIGGVYKFRTTSRKTIQVIMSGLQLIQHLTGGILAGLPLSLRFGKRPVTLPNGAKSSAPVVHVAFRGDMATLRAKAAEVAGVRSSSHLKMSELSGCYAKITMLDTPEDEAAVNEEFHPTTMGEDVRDNAPTTDAPPEPDALADAPWNREPAGAPAKPAERPIGDAPERPVGEGTAADFPGGDVPTCGACGEPSTDPICGSCSGDGYRLNGETGEVYRVAGSVENQAESREFARVDRDEEGAEITDGERAMLEQDAQNEQAQSAPAEEADSALGW